MKVAIIGAGNAGCITALHYSYYSRSKFEIDIYHNSTENPIERVGQGTVIGPSGLISTALGFDWDNNPIDATIKTGFMYEGWGNKADKIFHGFTLDTVAMHYVPQKLSNAVLESGLFNVIEKKIKDPEKEIDADIIFDCRGRNNRDKDNYKSIINPLNSVLLYDKMEADPTLTYTKCVATPNGWTFLIPNIDSVSYGYLYNNTITSKEDATEDFLERFQLPEIDGQFDFDNYIAKNMFVGERTILQGNRLGFVEPMEATSLSFYHYVCRVVWDGIYKKHDKVVMNNKIRDRMKEIETFILWHYQKGSKYDTPFWRYAKSLPFKPDDEFKNNLKESRKMSLRESYFADRELGISYGDWGLRSFKVWDQNRRFRNKRLRNGFGNTK